MIPLTLERPLVTQQCVCRKCAPARKLDTWEYGGRQVSDANLLLPTRMNIVSKRGLYRWERGILLPYIFVF